MDQELIAYLDGRFSNIEERFHETSQQIAGLREETTQQITSLREETTQQITSLREETTQNFGRVDEKIRQVHVVVEGLRNEIHLVAEGVTGVGEQLNAFKTDVAREFADIRGLVRSTYTELDRRIRPLKKRKA
jgi:archaellum component FlaC